MVTATEILHAKVLVVDDLEPNVVLLVQMLKNAGYDRVSSTSNPSVVCERHLAEQFDLILLDLQMPGMDGFEVMENLKQLDPGGALPVLVITAQPEHKLRALHAGARDFVSKPFELAEILLRVRNQIEARLLHDETRKLYQQVLAEQAASKRLLLDVLPAAVVERLERRPGGQPLQGELVSGSHAEVVLLFADLLDFNRFAEGAGAAVLTGVLETLTERLDTGASRTAVIDDAWLSVAGLNAKAAAATIRAAHKAIDLKRALQRFNAVSDYQLQVRIGLDSGPALSVAVAPSPVKQKARRTSPRK
jgi:adenylate cyclase